MGSSSIYYSSKLTYPTPSPSRCSSVVCDPGEEKQEVTGQAYALCQAENGMGKLGDLRNLTLL